MKFSKKFICFFLCLFLLIPSFTACAPKENDGDESFEEEPAPSIQELAVDLSQYTIVHSGQCDDSTLQEILIFESTLNQLLSISLTSLADSSDIAENSKKELLIGLTNRKESKSALEQLGDRFSFAIQLSENKISILGATPELTKKGLDYFLECCAADSTNGSTVTLPVSFVSDPLPYREILTNGVSNYKLIYGQASVGSACFDIFKDLLSAFNTFVTTPADFGDDWTQNGESPDLSKQTIVVGTTSYPRSETLIAKNDYLSWALSIEGNQIYVVGQEPQTLRAACDCLTERMTLGRLYANESTIRVCQEAEPIIGSILTKEQEAPTLDGGTLLSTKEFSDGFYRYYYKNVTKEHFTAYLNKLASYGYTLYAKNTADNNEYHTFYKDDQMIHAYYLAKERPRL